MDETYIHATMENYGQPDHVEIMTTDDPRFKPCERGWPAWRELPLDQCMDEYGNVYFFNDGAIVKYDSAMGDLYRMPHHRIDRAIRLSIRYGPRLPPREEIKLMTPRGKELLIAMNS